MNNDVALQAYLDALRNVHVLSRSEEAVVAKQLALGDALMWAAALRHPQAASRLVLLLERLRDVRQARRLLHDADERGDHSAAPQIDRASRALRRALRASACGSHRRIRAAAKTLAAVRFKTEALDELSRDLGCDARSSTARLLRRGQRVSQSARRRLVESAARLVVSVARHYQRPGVDLLDLIQDGNLALLCAVDKFDAARRFRFATYAMYWVRVAIFHAATEHGQTIRTPAPINQDRRTVTGSRRRLTQALGRAPTDEEVATNLGWTVRRVDLASSTVFRTLSLDLPIGPEGDGSIADLVANPDGRTPLDDAIENDVADRVHALLQSLPERHGMVLKRRFGIGGNGPQTLAEVATTLGLTHEGVRQIELRALARIRPLALHHIGEELMEP